MKILALEFSANERSAAVALRNGDKIEVLHVARESSRDITGLVLIDRALKQGGVAPNEISRIVIGLGPGSYTGIRSAIALAQGWQLSRNVQTIGIGSMRCLAATAYTQGFRGEFSLIVDAQRGDLYRQRFLLGENGFHQASDLKIVPACELADTQNLIGPEASKFLPDATDLSPAADELARLIDHALPCPAEELQPIYLRAASFVKAPPPRQIA